MTGQNVTYSFRQTSAALPILAILIAAIVAGDSVAEDLTTQIEFNRDIRPILSDHCFACHGPDAKHREADLRVDTATGLFGADGEAGPVVPGKLDESELWRRITSSKADEQMPPADFSKPLSDEQRKRSCT